MFLLYFIWGLTFYILNFLHVFIENNFLIKNNPFFVRRRTFKFLSYFEKIILVLFYKKGWFENSIANLFRKKDIIEYRRNYYPIIYSFHLNHDKVDYILEDLKLIIKQYKYYINSKFFSFKLQKILKVCFNIQNKNLIKFLMLQHIYIKKYYNLNSYFYFRNISKNNLIKFNRVFNIFLIKANKKLIYFNLDIWNDWYNYNFSKNIIKYYDIKSKLTKQEKKKIKDFKNNKIAKWINIVFKYKKRIVKINNFFDKKFKGILYFRLNLNNFFKIKINNDYKKLLNYYIIKFSESSVTKHLNTNNLKKYNIQYLRKNRIFNKGRYSRNRQLYRTGVYWCLWLNIIMVYGLYFIFYRFTFNFGYFWWGILVLAYSTIFSRIAKYNFYNINYIFKELISLISWYGCIINNLWFLFKNVFNIYFYDINIYHHISLYKNNSLNFIYEKYYYNLIKIIINIIEKKKKMKIVYMWQGMKEKDNSFLRYKTVIHWIKEIYRLIIT